MEKILRTAKIVQGKASNSIDQRSQKNKQINQWGEEITETLKNYVSRGKGMRGGMLVELVRSLNSAAVQEAIEAAVALEIIHSGGIMQDDVVDKDDMRRGEKSIHIRFKELGQEKKLKSPADFGVASAIFFGDYCYFSAFEILSTIKVSPEKKSEIIKYYAEILANTCIAEIDDVAIGLSPSLCERKKILDLYRYKTGQYSFSLPLITASILADTDEKMHNNLKEIGENIGIIFQMYDDYLGIFGEEKELGKPVGSDIKTGKKTIFIIDILENCQKIEEQKILALLGNSACTEKDIVFIQNIANTTGAKQKFLQEIEEIYEQVQKKVNELDLPKQSKDIILAVAKYSYTRKK